MEIKKISLRNGQEFEVVGLYFEEEQLEEFYEVIDIHKGNVIIRGSEIASSYVSGDTELAILNPKIKKLIEEEYGEE